MFHIVRTYCLFTFAIICQAERWDRATDTRKEPKVLILGAGMSGINAAKTLHQAGYRNFQILEASDTVGGRIREAFIDEYPVELGAMWIYGKGTNPIYKMAVALNLTITDSFVDNWTVRDETGNDVTAAADMSYLKFQQMRKTIDRFVKYARNHDVKDFSVTAGMRHFNWLPETVIDDVIESYGIDFETGVHPSALSSLNLYLDETFKDFGNHEMMAVKDQRGFSSMVRFMCESFLEKNDTRLLLNKRVTTVINGDNNVGVQTSDGDSYTADYIIMTFSLGVLQQRHVEFIPPLPDAKLMSIDKFGMAEFTHVYIQYPHAFWDRTMYILFASKFRGRFSIWQNMNEIYPGSNILQLSLFADDARWSERSTDDEIIDQVRLTLQTMYPNASIPNPTGFKVSRWNSDPLIRGAFSYWPATFTRSDMDTLKAPVGRLFFAGEHLHPIHYGFAHSAYLSGESTANDVMSCMTNPCSSTCGNDVIGRCVSSRAGIMMMGQSFFTQKFSLFVLCCSLFCFLLL